MIEGNLKGKIHKYIAIVRASIILVFRIYFLCFIEIISNFKCLSSFSYSILFQFVVELVFFLFFVLFLFCSSSFFCFSCSLSVFLCLFWNFHVILFSPSVKLTGLTCRIFLNFSLVSVVLSSLTLATNSSVDNSKISEFFILFY